jgi:hypothetical protein
MVWYLLKTRFDWSFPRIGREYGVRHSSVLQGIKMLRKKPGIIDALDEAKVPFPHIHRTNNNSNIYK